MQNWLRLGKDHDLNRDTSFTRIYAKEVPASALLEPSYGTINDKF